MILKNIMYWEGEINIEDLLNVIKGEIQDIIKDS